MEEIGFRVFESGKDDGLRNGFMGSCREAENREKGEGEEERVMEETRSHCYINGEWCVK